jgi:hypothetical protein
VNIEAEIARSRRNGLSVWDYSLLPRATINMRIVTERVKLCCLAPPSRLRRVALQMELRSLFEGVGWVEILNAFNVRFRVVVSLVVVAATNEHRK